MITGPCNLYPSHPTFIYSNTGVNIGIHYFLIFSLKHKSFGYPLELIAVVLTCTHIFLAKIRTILEKNHLMIAFTAVRNYSILNRRVIVMNIVHNIHTICLPHRKLLENSDYTSPCVTGDRKLYVLYIFCSIEVNRIVFRILYIQAR